MDESGTQQVVAGIISSETRELAIHIAEWTGENINCAVHEAIRERIDRLRTGQDGGLSERLLEIGRDCAEHLDSHLRTEDHASLLYVENGLHR